MRFAANRLPRQFRLSDRLQRKLEKCSSCDMIRPSSLSPMAFVLIIFAVLAILVALTLVLNAIAMLRPPRMTNGKAAAILHRLSPGDLGMHYQTMSFTVADQQTGRPLNLAAWWITHPGNVDRTVVLIHGYADAKVGAIAWAPLWQQLGWNILAVDLRACGESGGKHCTAGIFERHDLDQLLNQLRAIRPQQTRRIVLFGISLGAAVALGVAELRRDISALVLECPFASFHAAAARHAEFFHTPLPSLLPVVLRIARWLSGADLTSVRPAEMISKVACPVMIIQSGRDFFVPDEQARQIESAISQRTDGSVFWRVEDAEHLLALHVAADEYHRRLKQFLGLAVPE